MLISQGKLVDIESIMSSLGQILQVVVLDLSPIHLFLTQCERHTLTYSYPALSPIAPKSVLWQG